MSGGPDPDALEEIKRQLSAEIETFEEYMERKREESRND